MLKGNFDQKLFLEFCNLKHYIQFQRFNNQLSFYKHYLIKLKQVRYQLNNLNIIEIN